MSDALRRARSTADLAWLLGCLDSAVEALNWIGRDVDAKVVQAHRAALARGEEWPGDQITSPESVDPIEYPPIALAAEASA